MLYPGLVASTITAIFVIIVDVIIPVTGLLTIILPTLWVVQRFTGYGPSIDLSMADILGRGHTAETAPETDPGTDPESDGRPLLNVVGHLHDRINQLAADWLGQQDEMEPIDIVETRENDDWDDTDH